MTCKKKEALATSQLNMYLEKELNKPTLYTEKDVHNKIDSIMRKGKQFYKAYKNHTTGKELEDHEIELDQEVAEAAWPNSC